MEGSNRVGRRAGDDFVLVPEQRNLRLGNCRPGGVKQYPAKGMSPSVIVAGRAGICGVIWRLGASEQWQRHPDQRNQHGNGTF